MTTLRLRPVFKSQCDGVDRACRRSFTLLLGCLSKTGPAAISMSPASAPTARMVRSAARLAQPAATISDQCIDS